MPNGSITTGPLRKRPPCKFARQSAVWLRIHMSEYQAAQMFSTPLSSVLSRTFWSSGSPVLRSNSSFSAADCRNFIFSSMVIDLSRKEAGRCALAMSPLHCQYRSSQASLSFLEGVFGTASAAFSIRRPGRAIRACRLFPINIRYSKIHAVVC